MCNWEAPATRRQNCNTEELMENSTRVSTRGTQGIVKTKSRLRTKVWWLKLDADAEKIVQVMSRMSSCRTIHPSIADDENRTAYGALAGHCNRPNGSNANERDFVGRGGLLQQVLQSRRYAFNDNSKGVALSQIFTRFDFPHSLKSDNGPQFVSEDFQKYLLNTRSRVTKSNTSESPESSRSRREKVARGITEVSLSILQHTTS